MRILDLQTQKSTTVPGSKGLWSPLWSPDGKYLVALLAAPPGGGKLMLFNFGNTWEELASWRHRVALLVARQQVRLRIEGNTH